MTLGPPIAEALVFAPDSGLGAPIADLITIPDFDHLGPPAAEAMLLSPPAGLGPPIAELITIPDTDHLGPPAEEALLTAPQEGLGPVWTETMNLVFDQSLGPVLEEFFVLIPSRVLGPPATETLEFVTDLFPHFDTQVFCPEFPLTTEVKTNVLQSDRSRGRAFRRLKNNLRPREYEFTFPWLLKCEFDLLRAFVEARKGPAEVFTTIVPGESQTRFVRFVGNSFSFQRKSARYYEVVLRLREALCPL